MNKTALKNFATNARKELIEKVKAKAFRIGVTEENIKKAQFESSDAIYIDGKQLSATEKKQREKLISRIREIGYKQVVEEVSYTWFNRLTALRFMEVNNYLPTKVRVLSSSISDSTEPDIIKEALTIDLNIDKELVYELKLNNKTEELFKYLVIKQCNSLNKVLPFMFETIDDYKEILFPDGLLAKDSFLREMTDVTAFPESDWEQVEVIGWLYQYYISEEKDRVIKAKKKYKVEEIPFATQLFTPDWIVRYMVQNSLGRYWVEAHPEDIDLINDWEYYLQGAEEKEFQEKMFQYVNRGLKVEGIKCLDPAMGSGHILVYIFDVLFEIYSRCGYAEREIPRLIIENNLYGIDIDNRAYQLACFSVVMKAVKYNNRFLRSIEKEGLSLNLYSIHETNELTEQDIQFIAGEACGENYEKTKAFIEKFHNAKVYGSLIEIKEFDKQFFMDRYEYIRSNPAEDLIGHISKSKVEELLPHLINQAELLAGSFDVVVTNPPYMGNNYMNSELLDFVNEKYEEAKSDVFSAFILLCMNKTKSNGHLGFMTPYVWMFIGSYKKLRNIILREKTISSLVQLEYSGFEEATVPICTFTLRNIKLEIPGQYIKLSDFVGSKVQPQKTLEAVNNPDVYYRYSRLSDNFLKIPGTPIAFWASDAVAECFKNNKSVSEIGETRIGMATANNDRFLRLWHEVNCENIGFTCTNREEASLSKRRWFPYAKGGEFRKWYGNMQYVVNWENDGFEIRNFKDEKTGRIRSHNYNLDYIFKPGLTWTAVTSYKFSIRVMSNALFGSGGSAIVNVKEDNILILLGILNTNIMNEFLNILSSTMNYEVSTVGSLPFNVKEQHREQIENIVRECIAVSKDNWDSNETSWDFKINPIIKHKHTAITLRESFRNWELYSERKYYQLKKNEEDLNSLFIDIYKLGDMSPIVDEKDVTINKADSVSDIRSLISYAVGCIFGRYSLDGEGLIFAGGRFNIEKYKGFPVNKDNILPILSTSYFEDDTVTRFIEFVRVTFGEEALAENLEFISNVLGQKDEETPKETIMRYFRDEFYKDHVQTYKKKPIYWLFTSGKQKAFNCLIYMHRYDKSTLSRIRTDYLHELQIRMDAEKKTLLDVINGYGTTKEIANAKKELKSLDLKIEELRAYDEKLHHMADMQIEIDLDDGVAVNYSKFAGLLAPIK